MSRISLILFITSLLVISTNSHKIGDSLNVKVNKISPFSNPTNSYKFYALPLCIPVKAASQTPSFGERLTGNVRIDSVYKIQFGVDVHQSTVCNVELSEKQIKNLRGAIKSNFVFEMFIDDLTVGNALGYQKNDRQFLATHWNFDIYFNKKQGKIIRASVGFDENSHVIEITDGEARKLVYTYSVNWIETEVSTQTIPTGLDSFFVNESHRASYMNGAILSISTLTILFIIIQRAQGGDSSLVESDSSRRESDSSWKTLRPDVLVPPSLINLLSACVGVGIQLTLTVIAVIILGENGMYYFSKGSIVLAGMILYALTSLFAGLVSGSIYRYLGGKYWASNLLLTAVLFAGPVLIITTIISLIAWKNSMSIALPGGVFATILCGWTLGVIPLTGFGAIFGRTKVKDVSNDTPSKPLKDPVNLEYYKSSLYMILLAGLFSFSVLNSELYYVFSAIWKRKIFTSYGSLMIVLVMTINVAAAVSTIFTYFQLNKKDSRWWWKSFFYGGSCGVYVFLYAVYFYIRNTNLSGFVQLLSYFTCSGLIAFAAFLILGAAGFLSSSAFIKHIYERRKVD